jgi:hypothetical protein
MLAVAFMAGGSHEALAVGVGAALMWLAWRDRRSLSRRQWLSLAAFTAGLLILCLSPGSRARLGYDQRIAFSLLSVVKVMSYLVLSLSLLAMIGYKAIFRGESVRSTIAGDAFLWIAWLLSIAFNVYVGIFCNRQFFGAELLALIMILKISKRHSLTIPWMSLFGLFALYIYGGNFVKNISNSRRVAEIIQKYGRSADGVVYVDVTGVGGCNTPAVMYPPAPKYGERNYSYGTLNRYLQHQYAGRPRLTILPTILQGADTIDLGNRVVDFGSGDFLIIRSNSHPASFSVHRAYTLMGLTIPCDEVDLGYARLIKATAKWSAFWISDDRYGVVTTAVTY